MNWILFDIDGTLLSSSGAGGRAMYAAIKELHGADLPMGSVAFHGRTDRAIISDILKLANIEPTPSNFLAVKEVYLSILPKELDGVESRVFEGVMELLEKLESMPQVQVGLLTGNMADGAKLKLDHFNISDRFNFGAYGDEFHSRNDVAADAYRRINNSGSTQVPSDKIWIIGDTPADIECARHINARVLAVSTGGFSRAELEPFNPDILLDNLVECESFLEEL